MSLINQNKKQQLDIKIRDFEQNDYPEVSKLNNAVFPDRPLTADEYVEFDKNRAEKCKHRRWMATVDDKVVGTGLYIQYAFQYDPDKFNIWIVVAPEYQNKGIGSKLFDQIYESVKRFNPISIRTEARDDMPHALRFLQKKGLEEFQQYSEPHLEVDSFDFVPYETLEENLKSSGIEIKTMKELETDPERDKKLHELDQKIAPDLPDEEGFSPIDFDSFVKESLEASYTLPDAYFVAVDGDKYIGLSALQKFAANKDLYTGLTGVLRPYRKRGIATALKVQAIKYARDNNYARIGTDNQSTNKPMRSLNDKLGFKQRFNWLCYKKVLRNV